MLRGYPESGRIVLQAGLKLAVQRAILIISVYAKVHLRRAREERESQRALAEASGSPPSDHPGSGGGAATVASTDAKLRAPKAADAADADAPLNPADVLHHVMSSGLGDGQWQEVDYSGAAPEIVRSGLQPTSDHAGFLGELESAPLSRQPLLLGQAMVAQQKATEERLGSMDEKLSIVMRAVGNFEAMFYRSASNPSDGGVRRPSAGPGYSMRGAAAAARVPPAASARAPPPSTRVPINTPPATGRANSRGPGSGTRSAIGKPTLRTPTGGSLSQRLKQMGGFGASPQKEAPHSLEA